MNILLTISLALKGLLANKIRAFLTILGIIIGVAGIIMIVSVGNGAESLIVNQIKSVGANLIGILPGGREEGEPPAAAFGIVITTLKTEDIKELKNIPHVTAVAGYAKSVTQVLYRNKKVEYCFLLDEYMNWRPNQLATPSLTSALVDSATKLSFRKVSEEVEKYTAGVISSSTVYCKG